MFFENNLIFFNLGGTPAPAPASPTSSPDPILYIAKNLNANRFENNGLTPDVLSKSREIVDSILPLLQRGVVVLDSLPSKAKDLNHQNLVILIKQACTKLKLNFTVEDISQVAGEPYKEFFTYVCSTYYNEVFSTTPPGLNPQITLQHIREWNLRKTSNTETTITIPEDLKGYLQIDLTSKGPDFDIVRYYNGYLALIDDMNNHSSTGWDEYCNDLKDRATADTDIIYFLQSALNQPNATAQTLVTETNLTRFWEGSSTDLSNHIRSQASVGFLNSSLILKADTILAYANQSSAFDAFRTRIESSSTNKVEREVNQARLVAYILQRAEFNQNINVQAFESEITAVNQSDPQVKSDLIQIYQSLVADDKQVDESLLNSLNAEELKGLLLQLVRRHPDHPQQRVKTEIDSHSNSIGLLSQKILSITPRLIVQGYKVFDLLAYPDPTHNPLVTNTSLRRLVFNKLIQEVYVDERYQITDFGNTLKTIIQEAGESTDLSNPYVARLVDYLTNVELQINAYQAFNRPGVVDMPLTAIQTVASMIDNVSEQNLLASSAIIIGTTNKLLDSPLIARASTIFGAAVAVPMLLKEESITEMASVFHRESLSSVISERFYTETGLNTQERQHFPYFLKNLLVNSDFTTHTWGDFEDFVSGRSQNLIDGDSTLPRMLRGLNQEDPFYRHFHACLSKLGNRIKQQLDQNLLSSQGSLLDIMLAWIATDPVLREVSGLLDIDLASTLNNTPRAPHKEIPNEGVPGYVTQFRSQLADNLHPKLRAPGAFNDRQLFKHLNFDLENSTFSEINISPMYGQLFLNASSEMQYDQSNKSIQGQARPQTDALGNVYYSFKIPQHFTDDNRIDINQACVKFVKDINQNARNIHISFNAVTGPNEGIVGITVQPQESISASIARISLAPIGGDSLSGSFVQGANMGEYTPIVRILDHLVPQQASREQRTQNVLFTDPIDTVISKVSRGFNRVGNFTQELQRFWSSYQSQGAVNQSLHSKITGALMHYIQNGSGSTESKRTRLRQLSSYSGVRLYYEILRSTLDSSDTSSATTRRSFGMIKRLDNIADTVLQSRPSATRELIKSKVRYLKMLLGLAVSNVNSDLSKAIFRNLDIHELSTTRTPVEVTQIIENYFRRRLQIAAGVQPSPSQTQLPEQTYSKDMDAAWNQTQTAKLDFQSSVDGLHSIVIQPGAVISPSNPPNQPALSNLAAFDVDQATGVVTRAIEIPAQMIQGFKVNGRFRLKRSGNPNVSSYPHLKDGRLYSFNGSNIYLPPTFDDLRPYKILYLPRVVHRRGVFAQHLLSLNNDRTRNIVIVESDVATSPTPTPEQVRTALSSHFGANADASLGAIGFSGQVIANPVAGVTLYSSQSNGNVQGVDTCDASDLLSKL